MKIFFILILIFTLYSCNNNEKNSKNVISCDELSKEDQMIYQCEK